MTLKDHERTRDQLSHCTHVATAAQKEARERAKVDPVRLQSRAQAWLAEELGDIIDTTTIQLRAVDARILDLKKTLGE